jgi:hypothetical protein
MHCTVSHGCSINKIVFAYRVVRIKQKGDGEAKYEYKGGGMMRLTMTVMIRKIPGKLNY